MNIETNYQDLVRDILNNGVGKTDRTLTGTLSVFGKQIRHKMSDGFPLLTIKRVPFKVMATELEWFLQGGTNIQYLVQNNCNIWVGDAYKHYKNNIQNPVSKLEYVERVKNDDKFAELYGELGPIYGKQWRNFGGVDQIKNLIHELKKKPDSRRLMVSAWNPGEMKDMVLPPCHYGFQVYTRKMTHVERFEVFRERFSEDLGLCMGDCDEKLDKLGIPTRKISLMWNQRSVDILLGLPFNIASYALLLQMIANEVNMVPDELIGNLGDVHIYRNQIGKNLMELIERTPKKLPTVIVNGGIDSKLKDIELIGYNPHPTLKFPLSN